MLIGLGLLVVSALALLGGAELLTENAGSAARPLRWELPRWLARPW